MWVDTGAGWGGWGCRGTQQAHHGAPGQTPHPHWSVDQVAGKSDLGLEGADFEGFFFYFNPFLFSIFIIIAPNNFFADLTLLVTAVPLARQNNVVPRHMHWRRNICHVRRCLWRGKPSHVIVLFCRAPPRVAWQDWTFKKLYLFDTTSDEDEIYMKRSQWDLQLSNFEFSNLR
jgi:hypothetical protein